MSQETHIGIAPPEAPRPLTPRVRLRGWTEPRARAWWGAASLLLLIAAWLWGSHYHAWSREVHLLEHGQLVEAQVLSAGSKDKPHARVSPDGNQASLRFDYNGSSHGVLGYLEGRTDDIEVGSTVPIHIDPRDPTIWTARTEPGPLLPRLVGGLLLLPAVLVLVAVAALRRRTLLRTWHHGAAMRTFVVETHHTPLAPHSRLLRCTTSDEHDNRLFKVYVPAAQAGLQPGDELWILRHPTREDRAVAASWFQ